MKYLFEIEFQMKDEPPEHAEVMNVAYFIEDHLADITKHHDGTNFRVRSVKAVGSEVHL